MREQDYDYGVSGEDFVILDDNDTLTADDFRDF